MIVLSHETHGVQYIRQPVLMSGEEDSHLAKPLRTVSHGNRKAKSLLDPASKMCSLMKSNADLFLLQEDSGTPAGKETGDVNTTRDGTGLEGRQI